MTISDSLHKQCCQIWRFGQNQARFTPEPMQRISHVGYVLERSLSLAIQAYRRIQICRTGSCNRRSDGQPCTPNSLPGTLAYCKLQRRDFTSCVTPRFIFTAMKIYRGLLPYNHVDLVHLALIRYLVPHFTVTASGTWSMQDQTFSCQGIREGTVE